VSEIKVERKKRDTYTFFDYSNQVWGYKYLNGKMVLFADGGGGLTPAEARAFAAAIIAVADAVEKEGGK